MQELNARQEQIYRYIVECVNRNGYPPSVREIGTKFSINSTSTVQAQLDALEEAGYIARAPGRTRAITVTGPLAPGRVPILGSVHAGMPTLAMEEVLGYLPYDAGSGGEFFALRVQGDSMVNAGILDGDIVVVRRQADCTNGSIVIALLGDEATCKRLSKKGGEVWLIPENEAYPPIDGSEAVLIGKVTAVIRTY